MKTADPIGPSVVAAETKGSIEAGLAELDDTATVPLADVRRALAALANRAA